MRKTAFFLVLFAISVVFVQTLQGQTRPRRVGNSVPATTTPQVTTSDPARRAPVLGGNNGTGRSTNQAPQQSNEPEDVGPGDVIRVNTTLVSIPVSVMDRDGKYIPNLRKEDFRLWEEGVEQKVAYFASVEKPFTVALMLDTSGSTKERLYEIQEAAIAFIDQLRPDDRVMVVSFDEDIDVLAQPTNDRNLLRNAIKRTAHGDGTRLYDAVDLVINQYLNRIEGRKAVVLFTDGVDTSSKRATFQSNVRDAEELDALIYPVQFDTFAEMNGGRSWPRQNRRHPNGRTDPDDVLGNVVDILGNIMNGRNGGGNNRRGGGGGGGAGSSREEYDLADEYLNDLARVTGARLYNADSQNLSSAFSMVAEELRRQYSLGYYPKSPAQAGDRRHIQIKVDQPNVVVKARDSYIFDRTGNVTAQGNPSRQNPPVLKKDYPNFSARP
jgi:VWFA-related protein